MEQRHRHVLAEQLVAVEIVHLAVVEIAAAAAEEVVAEIVVVVVVGATKKIHLFIVHS